jgi:UDP-N-acetylmuramoyl-L-alanyl-D-glutamate--2,6-diaminopimelate ligase
LELSALKLDRLLKNVSHEILQNYAGEISQIDYDSRNVKANSLFICLRGTKIDGHEFINAAVLNGASCLLVEENFTGELPPNVGVVRVENTRRSMAIVSANFYDNPAKKLRLIGVTGTNGKTTTTYFTEEILRKCGRKTGLIGTTGISANGKPLEISFATSTTPDPPELHKIFAEMLALGVQDVAMEVSSHALALFKPEGLVFDAGVFTNLTQDHLDFHGTMENYKLAKAQLFSQSKFAVVNADDDATATMLEFLGNNPFYTYGIENPAHLKVISEEYGAHGAKFELQIDGRSSWFDLPVHGKFNVYNALAAIGTARALGLNIDEIRAAVSQLTVVPGRIQSVPNNRGFNIFIDYAHSPDGLKNIIESVREFTTGRVITLFGCGGNRDKAKRPIMGEIAAYLSDFCILTSDNPRTENPLEILAQVETGVKKISRQYIICENRRDAIFAGIEMLKQNDALIIAGKGHETYQETGTEKFHFDDFEVAREALK